MDQETAKISEVILKSKTVLEEECVSYEIRENECGAWAYPRNGHIVVGTLGYSSNQLASIFCHELAHILNFRNKKFYRYHDYEKDEPLSVEMAKMRIEIGLRAEIYTDSVAKKLMKKHYPEMKFVPSYSKKCQISWYRNNILKQCRDFLENNRNEF